MKISNKFLDKKKCKEKSRSIDILERCWGYCGYILIVFLKFQVVSGFRHTVGSFFKMAKPTESIIMLSDCIETLRGNCFQRYVRKIERIDNLNFYLRGNFCLRPELKLGQHKFNNY